jgi:hypothetical protein
VAQEISGRFMNSLADFSDSTPVRELLEALGDPAYALNGLTNAMLRERLRHTPWGAGRTDAQLCGGPCDAIS